MKNVRRIFFIVLCVVIVIPFWFYKGQAATIPSSYKLTDHITITPKDQGWFGGQYYDGTYRYNTCWAFASLNALETHIQLKSGGKQSPYFSVRHLDYLTSNYYNSSKGMYRTPLGTTGGVNYALRYFMNNDGPVSNAKSRLTEYPTWDSYYGNFTGGTNYVDTTPDSTELREMDNYTPEYFVHKVISFPSIAKVNGVARYVTLDSSYSYSYETGTNVSYSELISNRNRIKQHIMENGGVTALMTPGSRVYGSDGLAYSYTASSGGGHMVTIVGWDDTIDIYDQTNHQLTPPLDSTGNPAKGAYLILNSYGELKNTVTDYYGDGRYGGIKPSDGFEWVSYYDSTIELCNFGYLDVNTTKKEVSATFSNDDLCNTIKTKIISEIKNSTVAQCAYKDIKNDQYFPVSIDNTGKKITMLDLVANTYPLTVINLSSQRVTSNDITELVKIAPDINHIRLDSNNLSNINGLASYSKLTRLKANNNKIEDISGISSVLNRCTEIELKNQSVSKTVNNTDICNYPNLFAQAKNSSSKVYSSSGLELVNCIEKSDGTGVKVTDISKAATVKIKSGNAQGSVLTINVTGVVDRTGPQLLSLNVVSPSSGTYRAGQEIKIAAVFDENVYSTKNGTSIISSTAPKLKLRYTNSQIVRTATFSSVAIPKTIIYSITINNNDEGELKISDFTGTVYDISGNATNVSPKTLGGNKIIVQNLKKGDINGDDNINIRDLIMIRKYIANPTKWNLTDSQKSRADTNLDGNINIRDIIKIRKYIAASSNATIRAKHPDWMW